MRLEPPKAFFHTEVTFCLAEAIAQNARLAGIASGLIYIASTWGDPTKPLALRVLDHKRMASHDLDRKLRDRLAIAQQSTRFSLGYRLSASAAKCEPINPGSFLELLPSYKGRSVYCERLGIIATLATHRLGEEESESLVQSAVNNAKLRLPEVSNDLLGALFLKLRELTIADKPEEIPSGAAMITLYTSPSVPQLESHVIGYQELGPTHPSTYMTTSRKALTTILSDFSPGPHTAVIGGARLSQIEGAARIRVSSSSEEGDHRYRVVAVHGLTPTRANEDLIRGVIRGNLFGVSLV